MLTHNAMDTLRTRFWHFHFVWTRNYKILAIEIRHIHASQTRITWQTHFVTPVSAMSKQKAYLCVTNSPCGMHSSFIVSALSRPSSASRVGAWESGQVTESRCMPSQVPCAHVRLQREDRSHFPLWVSCSPSWSRAARREGESDFISLCWDGALLILFTHVRLCLWDKDSCY